MKLCRIILCVGIISVPITGLAAIHDCEGSFSGEESAGLMGGIKKFLFGGPNHEMLPEDNYIKPKSPKKKAKKFDFALEPEKVKEPSPEFLRDQDKIIDGFANNSSENALARDLISVKLLESLQNEFYRNVTFAIGNPYVPMKAESAEKIREIVEKLAAHGYLIVYDADSLSAPLFAKFGGGGAVGVSANRSSSEDRVIQISNPYIRMKVLGRGSKVVVSHDSLTGLGMVVDGKAMFVFDPALSWENGYVKWARSASLVFGAGPGDQKVFTTWPVPMLSDPKPLQLPSLIDLLNAKRDSLLTRGSMGEANKYQEIMQTGLAQMATDPVSGESIPQGAVYFGSGRTVSDYVQLVYDSARYLGERGVTIVSGGAGGFMEVANAGGFDAGAYSIGIPLAGGILKTERHVASSEHTHTIGSDGYESRIPLLLAGRKMIVIAPGGAGTVNELATALVMLGAESNRDKHLVFLSSFYYARIAAWMKYDLGLPQEIVDRIHIIDEAEELGPIIAEIDGIDQSTSQAFRLQAPREPRRKSSRDVDDFMPSWGAGIKKDKDKDKDDDDDWRTSWL